MIDVMEMLTGRILTYDGDDPERAVKLAFVQEVWKYFETWNYDSLFPDLPTLTGKLTISCGDYAAFLDGRRIS